MKNIFRLTAVALLAATLFSACTGAFEDMNTNPKGVSDEELKQDNNYIGMHFIPMMQSIYYNKNAGVNVWEYQLIQNLNADLWSGYISTATAFAGNVSNVTYAMNAGWNDNCWDYAYRNVMVESLKITNKCKDDMETYAHFEAINTICRVIAMSRLADQYGCIIYSHYGESATGGEYDSGQDAYKKFFEELKEAADVLRTAKEKDVASFMMFDYAYGGNLNKWAQLCNTIRLRLAMRIVKYDAAWAKSEAEAAMNDSNGLIETNDANFGIAGNGYVNPLYGIAFNYGDGVLGANIPSILSGMGDARLDKYATQNSKSEYFGIRLGIKGLEEEGFSDAYKAIVSRPNLTETSPAILATAAETILLEAEAALRGWDVNGKGTAQSLYEKKLITYPRTDSQYLTEDMEQTARNVVRQIYEKYQLTGPFDQPEQPDVKKVMNNSKVTDHHAIIPTMELASSHLDELKSWEEKILFLIAVHTVMAMSKDHIYQETEIEVECQGEIFKAKGRTVLQDGWKLFENCFKNKDRMAIVDPDQEMKERIPKVTQGQTFYAVAAEKTEHFTSPPKPYSEDTLLAAMETAGNKEFDEDTEKKGLGTPATRAGIIEKLIYSQYATRKGKQILPTDDGKVLVEILPDFLKSASMTAEWENQLLLMEHGEIAPEQFMTGIKNMLTMMLNGCDAISEEETRRFQTRESIGTCPVCGSLVYESKTNFYCSNHDCHFALWKDNRYLQSMEKTMDKKMAAELLKNGSVHVKDLYSRKKNMYFEADLHMDADETGKVNFSLSFPKKKPKNKSKKK